MEQKKLKKILLYIVLPGIILAGLVVMLIINHKNRNIDNPAPQNKTPTPINTTGPSPTVQAYDTPSPVPTDTGIPSPTAPPADTPTPSPTDTPAPTVTPTPVPTTPLDVVSFRNGKLEEAVRRVLNRQSGAIRKDELKMIETLDLTETGLDSLTDLEYLSELKVLRAPWNGILDISPVAGLEKLEILDLSCNLLEDVSPLWGCKNLKEVYLAYNYLSDVSCLADLENLEKLDLKYNILTDVSAFDEKGPDFELFTEGNRIPIPLPTQEPEELPVLSPAP